MSGDVLIAIPVYNEQTYLERVLSQVIPIGHDVLVIDDGSTDDTPHILCKQHGIHVLTHPENRGYGQSLSSAFKYAQQAGYDWLITMDCDEQHEPEQIPVFVHAALTGTADIISGTRYPTGHEIDASVPVDRRRINKTITATINERLGLSITDAFCGFKAYRVAILSNFEVSIPGYAMPMQWWVQVARANLSVAEIPIRLIYHDPTRHFGGMLDDPTVRLNHYLQVFEAELALGCLNKQPSRTDCLPCH